MAALRNLKPEKGCDPSTVPLIGPLDRDASVDALRAWAKQLDTLSEWMRSAITWPSEKLWSSLLHVESARQLLLKVLCILPRVHNLEERSRLLSSDESIGLSVQRGLQTTSAYFCRLAVFSKEKDPQLSEKDYVYLAFERKIFTLDVFAKAVALFAPVESSNIDQLMVAILKNLIRIEVRYKDDVRSVIEEHAQLLSRMESDVSKIVSLFNKSRNAERVRVARLLETFMAQAVDHVHTIHRFLEIVKKVGMRMEPRKFTSCIPTFIEAIYRFFSTEVVMDVAMVLPEYPMRRLFRLRSQLETFSASLFHFGINCTESDARIGMIQGAMGSERFIFVLNEFRSIPPLITAMATPDQLELVENGVNSICESQKRKLVQELERMGMLTNLGDSSCLDPAVSASLDEISQMFPQYSLQYTHLCLRHYGYSQEEAVNGLLSITNSLPKNLKRIEESELSERGIAQTMPTLCYEYEEFVVPASTVPLAESSKSVSKKENGEKSAFKGLFSMAPSKKEEIVPKVEPTSLKDSKNEMMVKLREAVDRLKLRSIGMEEEGESEGNGERTEKLVPMARAKKYCNTEAFKTTEADKVALRPFYDKYKFETPDEEDVYEDEYDDTYDDKAFTLDPVGPDASTSDSEDKSVPVAPLPVQQLSFRPSYPSHGGNAPPGGNAPRGGGEMVRGARTGRGLPRGMLSGKGPGRGGNGGYGENQSETGGGANFRGEERRGEANAPRGGGRGGGWSAPGGGTAPAASEQAEPSRPSQTSYTGGRDRQWKEKHKNEQKRRGADKKMFQRGV